MPVIRFLRGAILFVGSPCTLAVLTTALCACADHSSETQSVTVRDSTGITIVESLEALWGEGEGWQLSEEPVLTIGTDAGTAEKIEAMGAHHEACPVDDIVVDEELQIVSTPAYMLAGGIAEAASGIEKLVARVLEMA